MTKQRIDTFDIARAICILLVVIGHFNPDNAPVWWKNINACIYSFHMPMFLFISGFIYSYRNKQSSYLSFIGKKVKRLFVPYLITSFIVISIKLLTQGNAYVEHPVTAHTYLEALYLPAAGYYLWFVWALFIMLAVVHIFHSHIAHALLLVLSVWLYFLPFDFPPTFCLKEFQRHWPYFMCGVVLAEYEIRKVLHTKWFWCASIIGYAALYYFLNPTGHTQYFIIAIVGIGMVNSVSCILNPLTWAKQRIFLPISMASFTIYLYHTTFSGFAKAALIKSPMLDEWFIAKALIVILCGVIFPLIMYRAVKKVPILKWAIGE